VVDVSKQKVVEKVRSGWKKGDPEYEKQRRRSRKEVEVIKNAGRKGFAFLPF